MTMWVMAMIYESKENRNRIKKNIKKLTSKSILALRETEGGGLLLPPNFCQTCRSSFFCIVLLFFVFLYLLNSLLPHLSVAEVLSSFANCWYGSLLFANCRNKLFFKWSHQINFFVFQIVAAPAAPDHMYLQVVVQPHVTGGLN